MKKILVVFGTRSEAIKMCPLVNVLLSKKEFQTKVCFTGLHREMVDQVLNTFGIKPDYDLSIMKSSQSLFDSTILILEKIKSVLKQGSPDLVLVHGDTSSTFATALACFYLKIPVGHVEAGLRTHTIGSPFPEEFNRTAVGLVSNYHFAPTKRARINLIKEGRDPSTIFITGNTVIDSLRTTIDSEYRHDHLDWANDSRLIMVTANRREGLGVPLENVFRAIKRLIEDMPDTKVIFPVHLNTQVRSAAKRMIGNQERIRLIEPLSVYDFHNFLAHSYTILTDSGGVQEEAPSLGKPVLVMRDSTERPEGIKAGTLKLVGTNEEDIYRECKLLLSDQRRYLEMSKASNPYGDGYASDRIADIILTGRRWEWNEHSIIRSKITDDKRSYTPRRPI